MSQCESARSRDVGRPRSRTGSLVRCPPGARGVTVCAVSLPAREHPAVPHSGGVSDEEFRGALSRLAAGVVLVTAHDDEDGPSGAPAGMTATAFMSVSLDPPLVLAGVRTGSRMDDVLERQPLWAASLLGDSHRATAGRFAMKGRLSDRLLFRDVPHRLGEVTGAPLLTDALATVECRTEQRVAAGDHTLVIGRVLAAELPATGAGPLLYYRAAYRSLG
ncbi:reductase [Streptomyces sp. PT12]|nr:reductase [Streptomyces sp. PT12]